MLPTKNIFSRDLLKTIFTTCVKTVLSSREKINTNVLPTKIKLSANRNRLLVDRADDKIIGDCQQTFYPH